MSENVEGIVRKDCKNMIILLLLTTYYSTKPSEVNKSMFYQENIRKFIDFSTNSCKKHENRTTTSNSLQDKDT